MNHIRAASELAGLQIQQSDARLHGMQILSDPITLIAVLVAAFAGFRLWRILGQPEEQKSQPRPQPDANLAPRAGDLELQAIESPPRVIWQGFAEQGSKLAEALQTIADKDETFDTAKFLATASASHETILNAFAGSDAAKLKPMLENSVFGIFNTEIERRKASGETASFKFVRLASAKIIEADLKGTEALITVAFTTDLVSALKSKTGAIISGDEKAVTRVAENWTFGSEITKLPRNWFLVETNDAA
jgi:predicted lipid-binding transport protein (Tim44 family)